MRMISSGRSASPERAPASTCASGMPAAAAPRAPISVESVSPITITRSGENSFNTGPMSSRTPASRTSGGASPSPSKCASTIAGS